MKTDGFRKAQIERQIFYFEQSRKRLLSQFADLGKEADQSAVAWLEENSHRFDPDRDDPGSFEEVRHWHKGSELGQSPTSTNTAEEHRSTI